MPTEFLLLEYAGGDKLYVPGLSLQLGTRYSGASPEDAPSDEVALAVSGAEPGVGVGDGFASWPVERASGRATAERLGNTAAAVVSCRPWCRIIVGSDIRRR